MNPKDEFVSWDFWIRLAQDPNTSKMLRPLKITEVNDDGTVWARISNAEEVLRADNPVHPTDHTPGKG